MSDIETLKKLMAGVREQAGKINQELESAIQRRETLARQPKPKAEIYDNLCAAVDAAALKYEKTLQTQIDGLSRKRGGEAHGIYKSPDVLRSIGAYNEINPDAIHYFFGDLIKTRLKRAVFGDRADAPDGLPDDEYQQQLDAADDQINAIAEKRDALMSELNAASR